MNYVIVGDAATQLEGLNRLEVGDIQTINNAIDALSQ